MVTTRQLVLAFVFGVVTALALTQWYVLNARVYRIERFLSGAEIVTR